MRFFPIGILAVSLVIGFEQTSLPQAFAQDVKKADAQKKAKAEAVQKRFAIVQIGVPVFLAICVVYLLLTGVNEPSQVTLKAHTPLPDCCMICGVEPCASRPAHTFWWSPYQGRSVLGILLRYAYMTSVTIQTPLCRRHRHYWFLRRDWVFGTLALFISVIVASVPYFYGLHFIDDQPIYFGSLISGGICFLILAFSMLLCYIRPVEIHGDFVLLSGVSAKFVERLEGRETPAAVAPEITGNPQATTNKKQCHHCKGSGLCYCVRKGKVSPKDCRRCAGSEKCHNCMGTGFQ